MATLPGERRAFAHKINRSVRVLCSYRANRLTRRYFPDEAVPQLASPKPRQLEQAFVYGSQKCDSAGLIIELKRTDCLLFRACVEEQEYEINIGSHNMRVKSVFRLDRTVADLSDCDLEHHSCFEKLRVYTFHTAEERLLGVWFIFIFYLFTAGGGVYFVAIYNEQHAYGEDECGKRECESLAALPLTEVVEPLDFEEYVSSHAPLAEPGPLRQLLDFPTDDLELILQERECRTLEPALPEEDTLDPRVRDALAVYTDDWLIIQRKYQCYSTVQSSHNSERQRERRKVWFKQTFELDEAAASDRSDEQDDLKRRSLSLDDTPRGSWASSIFDLKNSSADALLPSLLERTATEDIDQRNTENRQQGRHPDLLGLYPAPDEV
ncbi:Dedicator of cytokinesis protein 6 [Bagarius yarrelli]|uniref:Dedicator of cytokinesis protein 6 n=1 Tax=Bagarius yarrelli TaxID=175774 RepID=A0A556V8J5_BAGYA|nr:Dedicator of cytokinesis protein 6 [Bagarius yarrelli]